MRTVSSHVLIALTALTALMVAAGCETQRETPAPPSISGPPGVLYVFHQGGSPSNTAAIWDNGEQIADIQAQKYVRVPISAGRHHISPRSGGSWQEVSGEAMDIDVQPGATYYAAILTPSIGAEIAGEVFKHVVAGVLSGLMHGAQVGHSTTYPPVKAVSSEDAKTLMGEMQLQENPLPSETSG